MDNLSQDELTVLMIAAEGEPMMPIGRWKEPMEKLIDRGYLKPHRHAGDPTGYFNNYITPEGRAAVKADEIDTAGKIESIGETIHAGQQQARETVEQIAAQLVDLANLSQRITGDDRTKALRNWAKIILTRALELMA